ncbi:unnamed protein product, partial [Iphiclides podalirius]
MESEHNQRKFEDEVEEVDVEESWRWRCQDNPLQALKEWGKFEDEEDVGEREGEMNKLADSLREMKLARKADTRRMAALSTEARRQHLELKRRSGLERMLLPDAPPRKRQTKRASPERQQCVMVARPVDELCDELNPVEPTQVVVSTSREADFSEPATTSGLARSSCRANVSLEDVYESSLSEDGMGDIGAEVVLAASTSPCTPGPSNISVIDHDYYIDVENWLADVCKSGDELEVDVDNDNSAIPFFDFTTDEPACNSDLTELQEEVLQREDVANDAALRDIAPDDCYTFAWSKDRETFQGRRETFTGTSGPTFNLTDQTEPTDIFDRTFDMDFIDLLCTETNRNAEQKISLMRELNKLAPHSRFNRCLYMPSQEIVIDESLLKWNGRLSFAQKISSKVAQVGVKTYELCESSSGYLWKFFVYAGKDKPTLTTDGIDGRDTELELTNDRPIGNDAFDRFDDDGTSDRLTTGGSADRPMSATAVIVYKLIQPLLHLGHTVIMDNFYKSIITTDFKKTEDRLLRNIEIESRIRS